MAYTPKTWANDAAGATPITAAELNRVETGVNDVHNGLPIATGLLFSAALTTYSDLRAHSGYVTTANGWPVTGFLSGFRQGTAGAQRLQDQTTGATYARTWNGTAWDAFHLYLDAQDIDAKGDLLVGTGPDTFARLTVGANGTVLTADSAEATGVKWATPTGGGAVEGAMPKRFMAAQVNYAAAAAAATATAVGTAAATLTATATTALPADAIYSNHATGAISGNASGMNSPNLALFSNLPDCYIKFRTGTAGTDIQAVRLWVGLSNGSQATLAAGATPALHLAAFRYDTVADTTVFWRCVTAAGTATQTVTITTVAVAADTAYDMVVIVAAAATRFYINGVLVATHTTNLPGAAAVANAAMTVTTLAALAKNARWSKYEVQSN